MKRRDFFTVTAAASLGLAAGCTNGGQTRRNGYAPVRSLGSRTLEEVRDLYRADMFERFFPNMDEYVIDHELGGFMTTVDIRTGEQLSSNKRDWYEGRGMWVYSFLYNYIEQDPRYLEVARKSKDFIMRHDPAPGEFFPRGFSREGEIVNPDGNLYGNLFIAEGLGQYAGASGEMEYFERAKELILQGMEIYDRSDYHYPINYLDDESHVIPGIRVLGHWMVLLIATNQMLEIQEDPDLEQVNDRCIDAIMNHHMNSDFRLLNEGMTHDFEHPNETFRQFAYLGHGIETLWMVLYEAARRRDGQLFNEAAEAFRRHVTVAHDRVYEGYFRSLDHVDEHRFKIDKVLWLQEEVLIGSLFLVEHTGDPWAAKVFSDTYDYVRETFVRDDYRFWIHAGDRLVTEYSGNRAENFHHPRHLMLNYLSLDRMIRRNGEPSGLFVGD